MYLCIRSPECICVLGVQGVSVGVQGVRSDGYICMDCFEPAIAIKLIRQVINLYIQLQLK